MLRKRKKQKILKLQELCKVYVDWANVYGWTKSLKKEVDPKKIYKYFKSYKEINLREILNAVFYLLRSGCSWRMLPHDLPDWQTVRNYFDDWQKDGTWEKIHNNLREKVRRQEGKKTQPSAGIIDSQSVKTAEKGGFAAMTLVKK